MKSLLIITILCCSTLFALNFNEEVLKELSSKEYLEHLEFIDKEIENLKVKEKLENKQKQKQLITKLQNLECMNENISLCFIDKNKADLLLSKNKDKYIDVLKKVNSNTVDNTYTDKQTIYTKYFEDYDIKFSHKNFKPFYLSDNQHVKLFINDKQLTTDNKNIFIADLKYFINKYSKNIKIVNNISSANYTLNLYKGNSKTTKEHNYNSSGGIGLASGMLLFNSRQGAAAGYLIGKGTQSILNNFFGTNTLKIDFDIVLKNLSDKCENQNIGSECIKSSSNKLTIKYKTKKMDNTDSFVFSNILTSIIANSTIRSFR